MEKVMRLARLFGVMAMLALVVFACGCKKEVVEVPGTVDPFEKVYGSWTKDSVRIELCDTTYRWAEGEDAGFSLFEYQESYARLDGFEVDFEYSQYMNNVVISTEYMPDVIAQIHGEDQMKLYVRGCDPTGTGEGGNCAVYYLSRDNR